ncbi:MULTISPECIES: nucleoside-diphosphate kinase [Pasteurellaceae]|uniref:Nucleoside-diphosphate kinase n=3 Tax=Pasteurellaceae TaxID=712 RepID=A0AAW8CSL1_9PAST|nr:nucleoside-diphosphate kinase [Pasteurella atlantica]MBR0574514.1 nucleoside-diphosphate kinase [Pasteurella atlantica]MDP8040381.1 nucleoside-diphosphate kinase [Pasteurella atlantica]MDP8042569.1 nucleoside-diphosphate kinase [Pasteurella atlantica]MDP8044651.1 nucleoside-diphosphate kinase [Pasteurella atlantica]MDP8046720.1 nucleoside-diphosphate kinase [Pasteurella atlantica]
MQKTLSILKPDVTERHLIGEILAYLEKNSFTICCLKKIQLTKEQAEGFYAEHRGRPYFEKLVNYMISAPVVVAVLSGENVICKYRELMGATDPAEAAEGTIRKLYALDKTQNSVHGSDSEEAAIQEIAYFFSDDEIID